MGTVTHTIAPRRAGEPPVVSQGGYREIRLRSKSLMGATYATGGDTVTEPDVPSGYDLQEVRITSAPALLATYTLHWDGSVSTPKIEAYVENATTGISAELGSGSAALAAQVVFLEFIYTSG
jgi:hypothetical protein